MTDVVDIPVGEIIPDAANLRQTFDEVEVQALAENMLQVGQIDPIQVFKRDDGTYDLFDGERRWRAAALAGIRTLRAIIIERPTPAELLIKKISRVMQTKTLSFQEEINALEEGLMAMGIYDDESQWSQAAKRMGVPPGVLRERMRVIRLTPKLRERFEDNNLDYTIAQSLGRLDSGHLQEALAKFIEESNLSNRFVSTGLIPTALENPGKSPIEIYNMARERERFRFAEPRKEDIPITVIDKLDSILADVHRTQGWLETISNDGTLDELSESQFNSRRLWTALHRLRGMLDAFFRVNIRGDWSPDDDLRALPSDTKQ